jgi:CRP/FNR family transcriptional regulator
VLFTAGDPSDGFYIVLSGAVRAFRVSLSGREQTIHVERTGGALAEVAVFDGDPYPSTAVAEEDSEVLFIAKDQMRKLMLQYPETALNALAYVAGKLRMVAAMMEQIALMDVGQRLAKLLLDEVNACAPDKAAGAVSFPLSLSHAQIAARLGSVREVITRALHKLAQQRIIEMRGRRIVVLDLNGLRRRAERHVSG